MGWGVFFWLLKFQIFFGVLEITDIFLGERAGPEATYEDKNESTAPSLSVRSTLIFKIYASI